MSDNARTISPLQAIRSKCLDCTGHQYNEIKSCPVLDCPLWMFRLGIHPFTKRNQSNPFLCKSYFTGKQNTPSEQLIQEVSNLNAPSQGKSCLRRSS